MHAAKLRGNAENQRGRAVESYRTVFEVIDMRSFSNLWYWIALAVVWSSASHWVLGVPWDLVQRAMRKGGQAEADFNDITRINVNRILYIADMSGLWLIGFASFFLTSILVLGWYFWIEFCQAIFMIAFPMSLVGGLSIRTARKVDASGIQGEDLYKKLRRQRLITQVIGMISIFVTSIWGMYLNLSVGALGS
ncbi:hypothetical protein ATO10_03060 [Actibacterium atlanticum]|uniref:Component of SufBCD complex n=1 Tax=Actibacterium atlanticum TaxID=1461693 RepID=A0A058ZSB1_9RHOB|nr:hypothetical protein ATO10_03060 [Actibacterium atlanticum]